MKKLEFEGDVWYYKIKSEKSSCEDGCNCDYKWTEFYKNSKTTMKKWLLWGNLIEVDNYNPDFILYYNIEDPSYSKETVRKLISPYLGQEKRKIEIEKGEII